MVWLYVLIGLAVLLVAAALYDRTTKGRARRLRGGVAPGELRTAADDQYRALGDATNYGGGNGPTV